MAQTFELYKQCSKERKEMCRVASSLVGRAQYTWISEDILGSGHTQHSRSVPFKTVPVDEDNLSSIWHPFTTSSNSQAQKDQRADSNIIKTACDRSYCTVCMGNILYVEGTLFFSVCESGKKSLVNWKVNP